MKKKTDRDVGADEASAVPDVSSHATPSSARALIEPMGVDAIRSRILTIRGVQVLLDRDLAALYGVTTGALNQAVKRNMNRFPERFMFQLDKTESEDLKSQAVISSPEEMSDSPAILKSQIVISSWGGSRARPYAFTEQGVAMLSSVLRSETAVLVSIRIMDAFVAMRKAIASFAPMLMRLDVIERRQIADQVKNDANQVRNEERFKLILDAMQDKSFPPQKVFYDGQIYDAFEQMKKFVRMARTDDKAVLIHVGATLNHLGKKCFAFSSMDKSNIPDIVAKI